MSGNIQNGYYEQHKQSFGDIKQEMNNKCFVVVDGYHGNDGYIDGTIRIFSTKQKAEEYIKEYKETMKKAGGQGTNSRIITTVKPLQKLR